MSKKVYKTTSLSSTVSAHVQITRGRARKAPKRKLPITTLMQRMPPTLVIEYAIFLNVRV